MSSSLSSRNNPRIKQLRALRQRKERQASGLFLVEGIRHLGEAADAGARIETVCYAPELLGSAYARELLARLEGQGVACLAVSAETFESLADRENPQGILAAVRQPQRSLIELTPANFSWGVALVAPQDPGNIGSRERVLEVARAAAARHTVIRVGVNAGSLEKELRDRHGGVTAEAMAESARRHCGMLEQAGCRQLKVSLKASDVPTTVAAYRLFAAQTDYPLHLGVTEAGALTAGTIKSAAALGCLLLEGIGDTLRVSLTAPPVEEVKVGIRILEAVGIRSAEPELISCPTCARTKIDLMSLVAAVEEEIGRLKAGGHALRLRRIAIMGCVVNGPGEAREADIGIAGGDGRGVLFRNGEVVRAVPEAELLPVLLDEIRRLAVPAPSQGRSAPA